jgi:3-polyprenyl-4-hydroxybenzoate decarboxylase
VLEQSSGWNDSKPSQVYLNSRAIIDATKPFEWKDEYPQTIRYSPELKEGNEKWNKKSKKQFNE